ncbi:hypothetical protein QYF61_005463, partial [Mycteria americana]
MLDNPFSEEKFPNIQSKPPLAQLEAISSRPITCYLGEETDPHLSTTSFQTPWLWNTRQCWNGYPYQPLMPDLHYYYIVELSFYWSLMFSQFIDIKRKDFGIMFTHHIVTVTLITFSYVTNLTRVGTLTLCLHDAADVVLETQRVVISDMKSSWGPITSSVPQGLILSPVPFNIFINDLDDGAEFTLSKFAHVPTCEEWLIHHRGWNLNRLEKWANRNLMKFSKGKCKVLHQYMLGDDQLESSFAQKDLGVLVDTKLTMSQQCALAAKVANALVRPHLEYCVHTGEIQSYRRECSKWSLRLIKGLEHLSHEERLRQVGLFSIENRKLKTDIIDIYKYMKGEDRTRGNEHELKHRRFHLNIRKHFFTVRVTEHWHRLPREVVESPSLEILKGYMDMVLGSLLQVTQVEQG